MHRANGARAHEVKVVEAVPAHAGGLERLAALVDERLVHLAALERAGVRRGRVAVGAGAGGGVAGAALRCDDLHVLVLWKGRGRGQEGQGEGVEEEGSASRVMQEGHRRSGDGAAHGGIMRIGSAKRSQRRLGTHGGAEVARRCAFLGEAPRHEKGQEKERCGGEHLR